jgi:hypothetical protein
MHYHVVHIRPETKTHSFQPTKVHPFEVKIINPYVNRKINPIHNKFIKINMKQPSKSLFHKEFKIMLISQK